MSTKADIIVGYSNKENEKKKQLHVETLLLTNNVIKQYNFELF